MTRLEDRLREAYQAAADTVTTEMTAPEAITAGHPAGWRDTGSHGRLSRLGAPLATAAAIALIAVATSVIATSTGAGGKPRHPDGGRGLAGWNLAAATSVAQGYPASKLPAAAQPRYYFGLQVARHGPTEYATTMDVYSTATGRQVSAVRLPVPGLYVQAVARLGGEYLVAATRQWPRAGCRSWLYALRLTPDGQPAGVRPFTVPSAPGWAMQLSGSSDGSMAVLTTSKCVNGGNGFSAGGHDALTIAIRLPSGRTRSWSSGSTLFNVNMPWTSLSADGRLLAFVAVPDHPRGVSLSSQAAYVMRTGQVAGPISRRYREVVKPPGGADAAALSPNGRVMFVMSGRRAAGRWHEMIGAYATATGKLIAVLATGTSRQLDAQAALIPDPSGRHLLVLGFSGGNSAELDIATHRLRVLNVGYAYPPLAAAW